jgi:SAM-dependent methyltransferase
LEILTETTFGGSNAPTGDSFYALKGERVRRYLWVSDFVHAKTVIDVGCGHGPGTAFLADSAKSIVGVDSDKEALDYARSHYSRPNLSFAFADVVSEQKLGIFDMAVSFEVIEHLRDPEGYLRFVRNQLDPSGQFYISTPNRLYTERLYVNGKSTNPYHFKEYSPDELLELVRRYFSVAGIFVEFGIHGEDEVAVNNASRARSSAPSFARRVAPTALKSWYLRRKHLDNSSEGKYLDYAITEVADVGNVDRTKPVQLYRLVPK